MSCIDAALPSKTGRRLRELVSWRSDFVVVPFLPLTSAITCCCRARRFEKQPSHPIVFGRTTRRLRGRNIELDFQPR